MAFTIIFKTTAPRTLRVLRKLCAENSKPVTAVICRKTRVRECLPSINPTNAATTTHRPSKICPMYVFSVTFRHRYLILCTVIQSKIFVQVRTTTTTNVDPCELEYFITKFEYQTTLKRESP